MTQNTKPHSLFSLFDVPLIRASKISHCELEKVCGNVIYLLIDDVSVRVEKQEGYLKISCPCSFCSIKGVAKGNLCRRSIKAIMFLLANNGRISEIYIEPKEVKTN